MITANSYFTIGKAHVVCEDYALSGTLQRGDLDHRPNITMAVIADGCSGSPNTDWGSRFMCQSAVAVLSGLDYTTDENGEVVLETLDNRGPQIYERADGMRRTCEISSLANDATLLVAYWPWGSPNIRVVAWGDGIIATRSRKTGEMTHHVIEYACNAPGYLSYTANPDRKALFLEQTAGGEHTVSTYNPEGEMEDWDSREGLEPTVMEFPVEDYDLVAVLSDGAQTFQEPVESGTSKGYSQVPLHLIMQQVMSVKNTSGDFVVRRVRNGFLNRFASKKGWDHYDDLSVGMVYVPDDAIPQEDSEGEA